MLFNVYDYDNQFLEQIEARDIIEAWAKARNLYGNVLDVRPAIGVEVEDQHKEFMRRRRIEARERREYYDSLSDKKLLELINSRLREYVPYPSDIPPVKGEGKTIGRMCLEGVANWLDAWVKGMTYEGRE